MIEFYTEIRLVHIVTALASGGLFLVRGLVLFTGSRLALAGPIRWLSYTVDVVLLTAALMLMTIVRQYPFIDGWLTVKVLLLLVYIGLGMFAFWSRRSRALRFGAWIAALAVFGYIFAVARAHDPLGVFAL